MVIIWRMTSFSKLHRVLEQKKAMKNFKKGKKMLLTCSILPAEILLPLLPPPELLATKFQTRKLIETSTWNIQVSVISKWKLVEKPMEHLDFLAIWASIRWRWENRRKKGKRDHIRQCLAFWGIFLAFVKAIAMVIPPQKGADSSFRLQLRTSHWNLGAKNTRDIGND